MNKMAQTLTNPVATNLVPLGKSLVTVREGISPHSVVEDNTFLCLTHKKMHWQEQKPFAMPSVSQIHTDRSWWCMSTFRLQNRIREEEKRVVLFSFDGQYFSCCLPIHGRQGLLRQQGTETAQVCLSWKRSSRTATLLLRTSRRVHSMSLLTGTELKNSEITAEARTRQINWLIQVLYNSRLAQVS